MHFIFASCILVLTYCSDDDALAGEELGDDVEHLLVVC